MPGLKSPDLAPIRKAALNQTKGDRLSQAIRAEMETRASANVTPAESFIDTTKTREVPNVEVTGTIIDNNIGTDRDTTSGRKTRTVPGEQSRFDEVTKTTKTIREYLEDPVVDPSADVVKWADQVWSLDPKISAVLPPPGTPERVAAIKELLEEPDLRESIRGQFASTFSETAKLPDEVTAAQQEEQRLKDKQTELETTRRNKNSEKSAKERHQAEFDNPNIKGGVGEELANLNDNLAQTRQNRYEANLEVNTYRQSLEGKIKAKVGKTGDDLKAIEDVITTIRQGLAVAEGKLENADKDIARQTELTKEKANLPGEIRTLESEIVGLDGQVNQTQTEKLLATATREEKQLARKQAEEGFKDKVKGIVGSGVTEYTKKKLEEAQEADAAMRQEKIDKAQTAGEKAVAEQEKYRYVDADGKPDKAKIEPDWTVLMAPAGGAKEVLKVMLREQFIKDKGYNPVALTPAQSKERDDWVKDRMSDQAFVDTQLPGAVESLIAARLRSGAKLTEGEAYAILSNPATAGAIDAAVNRNDALKKAMDELKKNGKMEQGVVEYLKRQSKGDLLKWLVLIFGSFGIVGIILSKHLK